MFKTLQYVAALNTFLATTLHISQDFPRFKKPHFHLRHGDPKSSVTDCNFSSTVGAIIDSTSSLLSSIPSFQLLALLSGSPSQPLAGWLGSGEVGSGEENIVPISDNTLKLQNSKTVFSHKRLESCHNDAAVNSVSDTVNVLKVLVIHMNYFE